ncbi:MAG: GNAT family N-acetyltransferase [Dermatophilaceae bacterium]
MKAKSAPRSTYGTPQAGSPRACPRRCDRRTAPETMPFTFPWTDAPAADLGRNMAVRYWRIRTELSPARWTLGFTVRWRAETVGVRGFSTENHVVTCTGETGSKLGLGLGLGLGHQGQGIGTLVRQTLCAFAFDHLDAEEVTSAAYVDHPASMAVGKKVGYSTNGQFTEERRPGELVISQKLTLNKPDLLRHDFDLQVDGLPSVRQFLGLGSDASPRNEWP